MTDILLTSREATLAFLASFPDPDDPISWTCPECHSINSTLYYAHDTSCVCRKYKFPHIPLPIVGNAKENMERAFIKETIRTLKDDVKESEHAIKCLEEEIEEKEWYVKRTKEEISVLEGDLTRAEKKFRVEVMAK